MPITGGLPTGIDPGETTAPGADRIRFSTGPNPSPGPTRLRFALTDPRRIDLRIFDPAGRLVRTLAGGAYPPGVHEIRWDGSDEQRRAAPSGAYRVLLRSGRESRSTTVVRLR